MSSILFSPSRTIKHRCLPLTLYSCLHNYYYINVVVRANLFHVKGNGWLTPPGPRGWVPLECWPGSEDCTSPPRRQLPLWLCPPQTRRRSSWWPLCLHWTKESDIWKAHDAALYSLYHLNLCPIWHPLTMDLSLKLTTITMLLHMY